MATSPIPEGETEAEATARWRQILAMNARAAEESVTETDVFGNPLQQPAVSGGIQATPDVVNATANTLSEATGNPPVTSTNSTASDQGFFTSTVGNVTDIVSNPDALIGGVATYAGGVINGTGETIADTYNSVSNTVGGWFGSEPDATTVNPGPLIGGEPGLDENGDSVIIPVQGRAPSASEVTQSEEVTGQSTTTQESAPDKWKDWRVKLTCKSGHLYNSPNPGILKPLLASDGLVFPYTPEIAIQHQASYENYDLTHSNYRGYFYKGSAVQNVMVNATFTAQDTEEANYMLAALHFLRSATKMFYGQDTERGMPPPLVFLKGLGEYHFNEHPCVITTMNYNLPNDVDYIAAGVPDASDPSAGFIQTSDSYSGHVSHSASISRLLGAGIKEQGGKLVPESFAEQINNNTVDQSLAKIYEGKTYVPTKIDIHFIMLPIQTRKQVSQEFSLQKYSSGELIKGGFW